MNKDYFCKIRTNFIFNHEQILLFFKSTTNFIFNHEQILLFSKSTTNFILNHEQRLQLTLDVPTLSSFTMDDCKNRFDRVIHGERRKGWNIERLLYCLQNQNKFYFIINKYCCFPNQRHFILIKNKSKSRTKFT